MNSRRAVPVLVVTAALVAGAVWWNFQRTSAPPVPGPAPAVAPPAPAAANVPEPAPAPNYPVPAEPAPALAAGEVAGALNRLMGRAAVAAFLVTDDFPRRVAATVDNLGRAHAPAQLWPVVPTPGRFTVADESGASVIAEQNEERYTPFVHMVEGIDAREAVRFYARAYPLLNSAYRDLGYPNGSFNNRLIQVIDLLLATPEATQAPPVQLVDVKGPVPSSRPWVRYEFTDPQWQSLAAGQKIMLRVGSTNEQRLKVKLREFRTALTAAPDTAK